MKNIVQIKPSTNLAVALRNIADAYEAGEYESKTCTLIIGVEVFHLGVFDDSQAAQNAVWDMTYGIHKLMKAGQESYYE